MNKIYVESLTEIQEHGKRIYTQLGSLSYAECWYLLSDLSPERRQLYLANIYGCRGAVYANMQLKSFAKKYNLKYVTCRRGQ